MATVDIISMSREKVGTIELDPDVFDVSVRPSVVHEVMVMQQASRRQGTASTKERGQVSGGGKKPWRQKGTGRARSGSNRSPIWRGGGTAFGPHPRRYGYRLPRKKSSLVLRGLLSAKASAGEVVVMDQLLIDPPKTKSVAAFIRHLGLEGKVLLVVSQPSEALCRATNNHPDVTTITVDSLNPYDVIRHRYLVTTTADLPSWTERLA